jgi:hypothetical protein
MHVGGWLPSVPCWERSSIEHSQAHCEEEANGKGVGKMTIKIHRMRITEKLGLVSVVELMRRLHQLGIAPAG